MTNTTPIGIQLLKNNIQEKYVKNVVTGKKTITGGN